MSKIDLEQLAKILNMTLSDNDNEALVAVRRANAILKKAGKRWNDILKQDAPWTSKPVEKNYTYKQMPEDFDRGWFNSTMKCKEFTQRLDKEQVDILNEWIRFVNKHGFLPNKAWTSLRNVWQTFREETAL